MDALESKQFRDHKLRSDIFQNAESKTPDGATHQMLHVLNVKQIVDICIKP